MKSFFLFLLSTSLSAQIVGGTASVKGTAIVGQPNGTLGISLVGSPTVTDTTIVQSFGSNLLTTSTMECTPTAGGTAEQAPDNNVITGLNHQQGVASLVPSTAYTCQVAVTNGTTVTATFTATTTATPATTAITGLSLGSSSTYNSINVNNQGTGDTFYNCKSSDGSIYMGSDDNTGFTISGVPVWSTGSGGSQNLMKVLSESPLTIQTIQPFHLYGDTGTTESDGNASRTTGVFCMGGMLFVNIGRQGGNTQGVFRMFSGNVIMSADHGQTFNNSQNNGIFATSPANPLSFSMFPGSPTTMAACDFIKYGADDGTLGYTVSLNEHDNGNLYIYLVCTANSWNGGGSQGGGDVLYLARVARAKMQNLSGADYQWYTSGSCNSDSSWTSTEASASPIITDAGKMGQPNVTYVPAKNRYLLLTFSYPSGANLPGGNRLSTEWDGWESPTPCGAWTKIYTQTFTGAHGGAYNPNILSDTIYTGTTPTLLWTGNFPSPDYTMFLATLTIN